jgi:ferredoxin
MSSELHYFSGTGNSFYIAKEIQKRVPEMKLIPIVNEIKNDSIVIEDDSVGFIFPLQGPTFPNAVKQFILKSDFSKCKYIYAIATRGGTTSRIQQEIDNLLKKKKRKLDAHFVITMFNNDPKIKSSDTDHDFHILTKDELINKEAEIKKKLDNISQIIIEKKTHHIEDVEYSFKYGFFFEKLIIFATKLMESKSIKNYFYSDEKCIGCGICKRVCLSERIEIVNKRPEWNDDILCYMCYACLNFCPKESVQINSKWYMKSYTKIQGRFSHPYIAIEDMENQKKLKQL